MHSLHLAYAAADLVVSRAGAMTCSEILATGKPSILVQIITPPNKLFDCSPSLKGTLYFYSLTLDTITI